MSRRTPDYTDDVLHSKIKNLVSGAIKRSALEKTEPTITYEDFVHDLETGDSFTTSLIDVLVKELAERRTRPDNNDDRKFIADRSFKSLRQLLARHRVYREHSMGQSIHSIPRRRSATLTDYLSAPPLEMDMEEDEDIFERILDHNTSIEGARINSDLYDAYGGVSIIPSPSPPAEIPPPQRITQAHFRSGPWSMVSSGPSTLTRQPSIRRAPRSRTVDFNEFTHRRRSSTRENAGSRGEPSEPQEPLRHPQAARRFFPFFRTRRLDPDLWGPDSPVEESAGFAVAESSNASEPSATPWFSLTPPVAREFARTDEGLADAEVSDERTHAGAAPRLRRGGVRAPESILSRHASPIPPFTFSGEQPANNPGLPPDEQDIRSEPIAYPTPGSTEHEFVA
ncbi:hypothetical protein H0H92_011139 [Tricholoma furcatifolium]|nr:hypothetical protein H0H92_011139 [Tricholoma furcatifolium]